MEKQFKLLKFLEGVYYGKYEKYVHFFVSLLIFLLFLTIVPVLTAFFITLFIGIFKEFFDKYGRKTIFDFYDLATNIFGICVGVIIYFLYAKL